MGKPKKDTGWSWLHPIDSIENWAKNTLGGWKDKATKWVTDQVNTVGSSIMGGVNNQLKSIAGVAGLDGGGGTSSGSGSGASGPSTDSTPADSGFLGWLEGLFRGNKSTGEKGGGFGGGIAGILLLLISGIIKAIGWLFGLVGKEDSVSSPDDGFFTKIGKGAKHIAHEVYEWSQEKVDNIAGARGVRNNNPGNLEAGKDRGLGSDGRFAVFGKATEGLKAMSTNLLRYQDVHHLDTIRGIVGKWAPASDGNDVVAYAAAVSKQMGVGADAKLDLHDPNVLASLTKAMVLHENGKAPYPDDAYAWGANAALNPTNSGKAPALVLANGKYVMKNVDGISGPGNTPKLNTPSSNPFAAYG